MIPVVTAEAARGVLMTDVVRMGRPCHLHIGKDLPGLDRLNRFGGFDHFFRVGLWIFGAVERREAIAEG